MSCRTRGYLITLLGVLAISPDGLLTRLIQADALTIAFWRGLLYGCVILMVSALRYRSRFLARLGQFSGYEYAIMVLYGVGNFCFIYSITHTSVANTLFMLSTTPIWAAVIAWLFLGEQVPRRTWFAIMMVILGIGIISRGSMESESAWIGDMVGLIAAGFLAAQFSVIRAAPTLDILPAMGLGGLLAALVLSTWVDPGATANSDMFWLIVMGVVMLPVANALMYLGPRYLPAPEVGLMMLLETVLGPIWVWLALGENPGLYSLLGGAIVLSTLAINTFLGIREDRAHRVIRGINA